MKNFSIAILGVGLALAVGAATAFAQNSANPDSPNYRAGTVPSVGADATDTNIGLPGDANPPGALDSVPDTPAMGGYGPAGTVNDTSSSGTSSALPLSTPDQPGLPLNTLPTERQAVQHNESSQVEVAPAGNPTLKR